MKCAVGPGVFESLRGLIHCLASGGEGACGQYFDLLCVSNFGAGVDNLLADFLQFLGELSELQHFSFDEGIS